MKIRKNIRKKLYNELKKFENIMVLKKIRIEK